MKSYHFRSRQSQAISRLISHTDWQCFFINEENRIEPYDIAVTNSIDIKKSVFTDLEYVGYGDYFCSINQYGKIRR